MLSIDLGRDLEANMTRAMREIDEEEIEYDLMVNP